MIWTEWIFDNLPLPKANAWKQMTYRIASLIFTWAIGFVIYSLDGKGEVYISNMTFAMNYIGTGTIVLYGSYMIQNSLPSVIKSFRPILKSDENEFNVLSNRITRLSYSFIPCLLIALIFMITFSADGISGFMWRSFELSLIWDYLFGFIFYLLSATGIWMGVSIWMTIFIISRQPLNIVFSTASIEKFKGLTMLALWFSLFYFLALSVGIAVSFIGASAVTVFELFFSPLLIFIIIGLVSVFFPFYNIHLTLLRMKKDELIRIEGEFSTLHGKLELMNNELFNENSEIDSTFLVGKILSLQLRERMVRNTPDWPIDIGFVSRLLTLVLIPALVRVSVELFNRFYL
jgi:hypothetical protein